MSDLIRPGALTRRDFVQRSAAAGTALAVGGAAVQGSPVARVEKDVPQRGIFSLQPAERWEEALLIGNGKMGGVVMGNPADETITLTHERLFMPIAEERPTVDTGAHLGEIRAMIKAGKYREAAAFVMKLDKDQGRPGRLIWADPFFPACDLRLKLVGADVPVNEYRRSLDFRTGAARVQWTHATHLNQWRSFISRAHKVVVLDLEVGFPFSLQLTTRPPDSNKGRRNFDLGIEKVEESSDAQWLVYRAKYKNTPGGYEVVARVVYDDVGQTKVTDHGIERHGNGRATVLLRIVPVDDFAKSAVPETKKDLAAIDANYDELLRIHRMVHGKLYDRMSLDLGGGSDRQLPAEQLWEKTHDQQATPALLERVFDAGRYQILCSCGDWPPVLQGIWAGAWDTPWRSVYTLNGNVPSAIGNLLNGNMPELMHSVFGYFEKLMDHFRSNAERHYRCRGILIPGHASRFGYDLSYNATFCHYFWTAGAAWYAGFYYDYYLYTGDDDVLRKTVLPFMKDVALFYEDFMVENEQGVYEFNPSYSPECSPANSNSQAAINATMDVAGCKQVLTNLIEICEELAIEAGNVKKWKAMRAKLPRYLVGSKGELKEWCQADLEENHDHRHCSHFLPLWYGVAPDIQADPKLLDAAKRAVELRTEGRRRKGGVMGFGAVQIGLAAASLGMADTVEFILERLATQYYYKTFASSHNRGPSVFNTDIAGGLPAVMVEMLVQSDCKTIRLLPALPKSLPSGRITGVPCRNRVTVEELTWKAGEVSVKLRSPVAVKTKVQLPAAIAFAQADRPLKPHGDTIAVELAAGQPLSLKLKCR